MSWRPSVLVALVATSSVASEPELFHGWSKDGTWLVYEVHGENELVELYFCATTADVPPSWPKVLEELEREETSGLSCVRFLDPNKAPYRWKAQLVLPAPSMKHGGVEVSRELATDGETPGFVLQAAGKKEACYASGLREGSKLERVWFHPKGQWVAALIDGTFRHCAVPFPLRAAPARSSRRR